MRTLLVDEPLPMDPAIRESLDRLGEVHSVSHSRAVPTLIAICFDLVIVNAARIDAIGLFIARVHFQKLCPRVVVVTEDSSWRFMRNAFHSGATDCLLADSSLGDWRDLIGEISKQRKLRHTLNPMRGGHEQSYHPSS